jgi:hypothetical protein
MDWLMLLSKMFAEENGETVNGEEGVRRPPLPCPSLLPASISKAFAWVVASREREHPRKT